MKKFWEINAINNVLSLHARFSRINLNKAPLSATKEFDCIAIFSTTALGVLLFNTPAIRMIKNCHPSEKNRAGSG